MLKKIIATSLVASALIFSGCGTTDAEGEARLESQVAVDDGNFALAIANLEAIPVSQRSDSDNLTLASAYMGEAGVSFVDVITLMGTDPATTNSSSSFESFAKQIDEKKNTETLANIDKAIAAYAAVSTVSTAPSKAITATDNAGDTGLFLGIAYMVKATFVMSYLGNIANLGSNGVELVATADALKCVYGGVGCAALTFTTRGDGNVDIAVPGALTARIASPGTDAATRGDLILTDYETGAYAVDGNYTIKTALIDTINGGFDAILSFAPAEVQDDIVQFRTDIDADANGYITETEIATFIQ